MYYLLFILILSFIVFVWIPIREKNINIWFWSYLKGNIKKKSKIDINKTIHIMFCFVDHFEPPWNKASYNDEIKRVNTWLEEYPRLASKHKDSDGKYPQHTFFYPEEEYRKEHLDKLAKLCKDGYGEVEIHLHHDDDTAEGLKQKIEKFKIILTEHGFLSRNNNNIIQYGFVHGNWALDNSRKDGKKCGVNNELIILKETGCYADFTLPSAPSDTQTQKINCIYYAKDDPDKPKSHNSGIDVEVGKMIIGDLMIIQGPLTLNWKMRKLGIFPKIEHGDIGYDNPPSKDRVDLWIKQNISIKGKPDWIFVKIHTHGCQEKHFEILFGKQMEEMFNYLEEKYSDGKKYKLHYVTTREMYNIIKAAETGKNGNPNEYRDYILSRI